MRTSVLLRVQARGGKFLGPDIDFSHVTVRDVQTGKVLTEGDAEGDSGVLGPRWTAGASPSTIVTRGTSGPAVVRWLSPTPRPARPGSHSPTAGLLTVFDLNRRTEVEFSATMRGSHSDSSVATARMWLEPGLQLTDEPGLILMVPGLAVTILHPSSPATAGAPLSVEAFVTMMCGCKIDHDTPWPPGAFTIKARLRTSDWQVLSETTLSLSTTSSTFAGTLASPPTGTYTLTVDALQPAETNAGSAQMTVTVA